MNRSTAPLPSLLLACALAAPVVAQEPVPPAGDPAVATARFELWNEPPINLHHFLVHWAAAEAGERPRWAPELAERTEGLGALSAEDRETWMAAVDAYRMAIARSFVFDPGLIALRDHLVGRVPADAVPEADRPLAGAVRAALPVYERHWWDRHREQNRDWIAELTPALREAEESMVGRVEAAYGGRWPGEPIPVDVVAHANFVGAYSTGGRLTLASGDPDLQMPQSLELVFHESSHVDPLEVPLREAILQAFRAEGAEPPDRLWHDVIFFTTGEITRIVLSELGTEGYRHYGETAGVYRRGDRWPAQLRAFERHWRPFLETGPEGVSAPARMDVLRAVARELARR